MILDCPIADKRTGPAPQGQVGIPAVRWYRPETALKGGG